MLTISLGILLAIHGVESNWSPNCRPGDGGRALGPMQIHARAAKDAGYRHRAAVNERVAYATAYAYLCKYNTRISSLDDVGRLYNGGPRKPICKGTSNYIRKLRTAYREVESARVGWLAYLDDSDKQLAPPNCAAAKAVWRHVRHKPDVRQALQNLFTEAYTP